MMNTDKKKNWIKTTARNAGTKKIKRKKVISGDMVQENIIESKSRENIIESKSRENIIESKSRVDFTSRMLSEMDNFASKNESPKSDLDIISSVMGQEVRTVDTYYKKSLNSEIPTLDSIINDLKEFKFHKMKFEKFIDDIPNLVDLEKFNKEIFSLKESIKKSKSNEILAEEVKQELLDEISKVDKRVTTQYHNAGSGEVRLLNLDDVQGVPANGDILVFDSSINKFRAGPDDDDHSHTGSVTMSETMAMAVALGG